MNLLIIFNPHAGSGRAKQYLSLIEGYLNNHQISHQIMHTQETGHAKAMVGSTDLSGYTGVVAAGGDGTLFEVVNGLMHQSPENRPPLGVIPVGTGNAFARELKLLSTDWQAGLDIILKQQTHAIDIGSAESSDGSFYFLNIIGLGFVVDAGRSTVKIKKLGKSAYTLATLWQTAKLKKYPMQLTLVDDHNQSTSIDEELVFVEVANSRYTGTAFLIAPQAEIDDGLLDVIILRKISRFKILSLFPTIYTGKHINYPEVLSQKVKSIGISTEKPMPLMADGEFIGQTPVHISCLKHALKIFV